MLHGLYKYMNLHFQWLDGIRCLASVNLACKANTSSKKISNLFRLTHWYFFFTRLSPWGEVCWETPQPEHSEQEGPSGCEKNIPWQEHVHVEHIAFNEKKKIVRFL